MSPHANLGNRGRGGKKSRRVANSPCHKESKEDILCTGYGSSNESSCGPRGITNQLGSNIEAWEEGKFYEKNVKRELQRIKLTEAGSSGMKSAVQAAFFVCRPASSR
jgi:hypothetical protein